MLGYYIKGNLTWCYQHQKTTWFCEKKTKNYLKKPQNDLEKLHLDFSEERKKERLAGHVSVFCQNLVYTLENYFNFRRVLIHNRSILEKNYYYRTRKNVSFTESKMKNTLSNHYFAELDISDKLENLLFMDGVATNLN